ncbi:hypothetical protein [Propionicicella superfundia]|uniref:hypothetical protein n=1 Tax=Propionicicella superfundia TaxID=348582 RepID=UPI00041960DA|nr:hypothetical protein [Propionicicella superfundia]
MTVKLRSVIVAVIAGLLLLTGCSTPPAANVGVRVGDQTIGTSEIDEVIALIGERTEYQVQNTTILQVFAASAVAEQYAADRDVAVSEADIEALVGTDAIFQQLGDDAVAKAFERRVIRTSLIAKQITSTESLQEYDVVLNPRYGVTWNAADSTLVTGSTSLSTLHTS